MGAPYIYDISHLRVKLLNAQQAKSIQLYKNTNEAINNMTEEIYFIRVLMFGFIT
jgi:hypothetical protein